MSSAAAGTLSTGTYGSSTSTFNSGTGVWTVSGTVANVNAALAAVSFTPSSNNEQNFTIATRIRDAADAGPANGSISFTVSGVNDPPKANNDNITVAEDSGATVVNVLANDSSAPDTGETLTVTGVTQPDNGTVTLTSGVVRFTPSINFNGTTSFTYTISDGNGGTATATVNVTVSSVNDSPVANDDNVTVNENSGATVVNVLANDSSAPDTGETLTVTAVTQPTNGSVTLTAGVVRFTPNPNYHGTTTFTYTISDGNGASATATVEATVVPNVLPVELVSFRMRAVGRSARLEWSTATEINNGHFEIHRSDDGVTFTKVGVVLGKGSGSKYELNDYFPFNGTNYYRLIQFDKDGKSKELGHQVLDFKLADVYGLTAYPNPVVDQVRVEFAKGAKQLLLLDITGKVLQSVVQLPIDTGYTFKLGNLPKGIYFIKLLMEKEVLVKKLVKN